MAHEVTAATVAYAKQGMIPLEQESKFAIANDPSEQVLSVKGRSTVIRQIKASAFGDYEDEYPSLSDNGIDAVNVEYEAPFDRAWNAQIDSLAEAQSYVEGAKPTLVYGIESALKNELAPEIDTVMCARLSHQVSPMNVHRDNENGYKVDKANIFDTLLKVEADIANSGTVGDIYVFISTTINAALESALINSNALANYEVIRRSLTKEPIVEMRNEKGDVVDPLEVTFKVRRINNMLIIPVPDNRMAGLVYLLDKKSPGQEAGGVLPAKNKSDYYDVRLLAIPKGCFFVNIRHIMNDLFVPLGLDFVQDDAEINYLNKNLFGSMWIRKEGINQRGDRFDAHIRCVYGGDIFELYRDNCVLITSTVGTQDVMPQPGKMEVITPAADLTGASAATVDVKMAFEPLCAGGTIYVDSATTASATVTASTTLVAPTEGDDIRPYAQVTVTFGATAGSSKITVYGDSAKHIKIGEFTVTSTGA